MAWERSFEARVLKIRDRELKYQKLNYTIEVRHSNYNDKMHPELTADVDFMERDLVRRRGSC